MMLEIPPEYRGREQTYLKHRVLTEYLRAWGQKLGSRARGGPVTIYYVDCFAGPWRSAQQAREDTSVAIGLKALGEARGVWRGQHRADLRACALFVEKDRDAFAQLETYVKEHRPSGVTAEVLHGEFLDNVSEISRRIADNTAFIFVDPTGWKGVGMAGIAELAGAPHRDVMINVMYDHINRFKDDPRRFLREQMHEFFALTEDDLPPMLDEDELMGLYRDRFRKLRGLRFVADLAVPHPTNNRTYFRLVLGAGHPAAIELFRNVEAKVCGREAADVREGAEKRRLEKRGQTSFDVGGPGTDSRYARIREQNLATSRQTIVAFLAARRDVRFKELWPEVLAQHHLTVTDLKKVVHKMVQEGLIDWRPGKAKQHVVADEDVLALVTAPGTIAES